MIILLDAKKNISVCACLLISSLAVKALMPKQAGKRISAVCQNKSDVSAKKTKKLNILHEKQFVTPPAQSQNNLM